MIGRIEVKAYRRAFRQPLRTARGAWTIREGFILRIETGGGVGYGEVAPLPEFGSETVAEAGAFLKKLEGAPNSPVPADLPCCAFALSSAGWSATAPMRDYSVSGLLPAGDAAREVIVEKWGHGYRSFKWKIGVERIDQELAIARDLLETLPEGVTLRFDANGGLTERAMKQWLECLRAFPSKVDYLEQPMGCGEEATMAAAMEASGVAIALDESLNGAGGARWIEVAAWPGPLVVKAPLMGAVGPLIARLRSGSGRVTFSSVFETGVGLEASLRMLDALGEAAGRALGFDTVDAFGDRLNHLTPTPKILAAERLAYNPEAIWESI